jgi:3',5'-cyclic AMP phosphodiesterase CpdA
MLLVWLAWAVTLAGAEPKAPIRIGFLADTHVSTRTNNRYVVYHTHFVKTIAAINAAKVDLVLISGDLTDNGAEAQMDRFKQMIKGFEAPVLFVPGNHDIGHAGSQETKMTISPKRLTRFRKQLGPDYFERQVAGVRIIGLDSCVIGTGYKEENEQWAFLEKELAKPWREPTLLIAHYPLRRKTADEPNNGVWNAHPDAQQRLIRLAKQGGVRAVLTGHFHYPIENRLEGILFLSTSATAFGVPRDKQTTGWMLLTVPPEGEIQFQFEGLE